MKIIKRTINKIKNFWKRYFGLPRKKRKKRKKINRRLVKKIQREEINKVLELQGKKYTDLSYAKRLKLK